MILTSDEIFEKIHQLRPTTTYIHPYDTRSLDVINSEFERRLDELMDPFDFLLREDLKFMRNWDKEINTNYILINCL